MKCFSQNLLSNQDGLIRLEFQATQDINAGRKRENNEQVPIRRLR